MFGRASSVASAQTYGLPVPQRPTVEYTHVAGPNAQPAGQCRVGTPRQQLSKNTSCRVDPRISGSARARLPDGEWRSRPQNADTVQQWHAARANLGRQNLVAQTREDLPYQLADLCTTLMRQHRGAVADVARSSGGALVAPPIDPAQI